MAAEMRAILTEAVAEPASQSLFSALQQRFADLGGVDLDIPRREAPPRAADLSR